MRLAVKLLRYRRSVARPCQAGTPAQRPAKGAQGGDAGDGEARRVGDDDELRAVADGGLGDDAAGVGIGGQAGSTWMLVAQIWPGPARVMPNST